MIQNAPYPNKQWSKNIWDQIKGLSKKDLIDALMKDKRGVWEFVGIKGAQHIFHTNKYKPPFDILSLHYHKKDTHGKSVLTMIIDHICWQEGDLKDLKLIK